MLPNPLPGGQQKRGSQQMPAGEQVLGSVPKVKNRRSCGRQTAKTHRLATVATEFSDRA